MEDAGSPLHSTNAVGHSLSLKSTSYQVAHSLSFKSNPYQVFYGKGYPAPEARSRGCSRRPRLRLVLLGSFGVNLAITSTLLTLLWYTNNQDASEALLEQHKRSNELCTSACDNSISSLATRLHAVLGEEQDMAVQKFISEPLMVLQNTALMGLPEESGTGSMDANLKLMLWQLSKVFKSLEGIFYADARGVYAEYERLSHHAGHEGVKSFSFEYVPGDRVNETELKASCPTLCPPARDLLPGHKSVYAVANDTGTPVRMVDRFPIDVQALPWYRSAVQAKGQVVWDGPRYWRGTIRFRVVQAKFQGDNMQMMAGADFTLDHLSRFLQNTEMARIGLVFIVDRRGRLISSSAPLGGDANASEAQEVPLWRDVDHPLIRAVYGDMIGRAGGEAKVGNSEGVQSLDMGPGYIYSHRVLKSGSGEYDFEWIVVNVQSLGFYKGPFQTLIDQSKAYEAQAQEELSEKLNGSVVLMLLISAVFLLAQLATICALAQAVTIPLKELQSDMRAVARLEFGVMDDVALHQSTSTDASLREAKVVSGGACFPPLVSVRASRKGGSFIQEIADIRESFTSMATGLQSFARYMDPSLVRMLVQSKRQACLGVAKATVTIFFSDIVNFTALAERLEQGVFMSMLGEYLDGMSGIIMSHGGIVGEFIGDAIMAWWNAPEDLGEWHTVMALTAALEQQACLSRLREQWAQSGLPELRARMGLARGEVLAGNIGSPERMKYGLVGDTVNLASRLESLCKRYDVDILIDDAARKAPGVEDAFLLRPLGLVTVKGRTSTTELFELVGPNNDESLEAYCEGFAAAQALYRAGAFQETLEVLGVYERRWPGDRAAKMLKQRCQDLIARPPGPDWSPVEVLMEK